MAGDAHPTPGRPPADATTGTTPGPGPGPRPGTELKTVFDLDDPDGFGVDLSVDPDGGYEDGNVLAGPLSEVFRVDVTTAAGSCAGCGRTGALAQLRVYRGGPGWVARCPGCGAPVLRLVRGPAAAWLDLRGTVSLRIPLDEG